MSNKSTTQAPAPAPARCSSCGGELAEATRLARLTMCADCTTARLLAELAKASAL